MWVVYISRPNGYSVAVIHWSFHTGLYPTYCNESEMMIPGTFAEMHEDYD
jgi:hypothetical protein